MKDNERAFLLGLEKLTRETGIIIDGCGCCNSPYLRDAKEGEMADNAGYGWGYADEVHWVSPGDKYDWERCRKSIVKPQEGES